MQKIRIASRNSPLAMWQTNYVAKELINHYPQIQVEIIGLTTQGDKILNQSLALIGGKGLFIKELEVALLEDKADIAVHSLKDLPANLDLDFKLAAILKRENPSDAFVSNLYSQLDEVPAGGVIGTSSARRKAFLNKYYPALKVDILRGNLQTRLNKLDQGAYAGIILASCGLTRMGLANRISQELDSQIFIPAIGQGALGVEIKSSNHNLLELLKPLNDPDTERCVVMERKFGEALQASCNLPIAAYATIKEELISLEVMLANEGQFITNTICGKLDDYLSLAHKMADNILNNGGKELIESIKAY